tara:strand:- start:220 stop:423 length:204 start_codon:yes stop_codon:yes gene_type:complete
MDEPTFYCSQCGSKCEQESKDMIDYHFTCLNGHRWSVTIDIDHPTTGGQIIGFQCAGARARDYFKVK